MGLSHEYRPSLIKSTYEQQLYTLSPFKEGHYGLRMYLWSDMARVASRLNRFASEVYTPEQIILYSEKRIASYLDDTDERSVRRYTATKHMPEYLYLGVDLLGSTWGARRRASVY